MSWADALQKSLSERTETVPDGWQNVFDIADELNCSPNWAYKQACEMVAVGKAERRKFRVIGPTGTPRKMIHFKLKGK